MTAGLQENSGRLLLVGCGILKKEIKHLIRKNHWPLDTQFIDSALHVDFQKLSRALTGTLERAQGRDVLVFYGTCHPMMDSMISQAGAARTHGQNCLEMLLGPQAFNTHLERGAFFLLEEWAHRWERIVMGTMGSRLSVIREIYQGDRNRMLAVRTPCSEDFTAEAVAAAELVGLPLEWMDVSLDHLEQGLTAAIDHRIRGLACRM